MSGEQTRRTFFKSAAVVSLAYAIGGRHLSAQTAAGQRPDADLILMNGRLATQDERRSFASAVAIKAKSRWSKTSLKLASTSTADRPNWPISPERPAAQK